MPNPSRFDFQRATLCRRPRVTLVISYAEAELEERWLLFANAHVVENGPSAACAAVAQCVNMRGACGTCASVCARHDFSCTACELGAVFRTRRQGYMHLLPQWVGPPYADKGAEKYAALGGRLGSDLYPCDAAACPYA